MADSDSFFDDDDSIGDSFPGAPSEELLRDSAASFEELDDVQGLDADTPDAAMPQEELIAKAQKEAEAEAEQVVEDPESAKEDVVAATAGKKKGRFNFGSFDTSEVTIFDAALLISLLFISLATLMLFFELRQFGNFPFDGFPWRTDKL